MFHIQTKANYMIQTILVGGAKYRSTGRGFATQHTPMNELYRLYAPSHFYLGVELVAGLIIMGIFTEANQYFGRTWSLWLASLSFLASPFWFNPLTFDWNVVISDYMKFIGWMRGNSGGSARSWSIWYIEEFSYYSKIPIASKSWFVIKSILYLVIAEGIATSNLFQADTTVWNEPVIRPFLLVVAIVVLFLLLWLLRLVEHHVPYLIKRTLGILISTVLVVSCIAIFIEDTNFFRFTMAAYYAIGAMSQLGLLLGVSKCN